MSKKTQAAIGRFPSGPSSLRAQVLAVLLASNDMTGVESLFEHRKVSLTTVVRALTRKYGWPVERRDFATNTDDGRAAWASVFCLPQEVIDAALEAGGRDWLDGVAAARAARGRRALRR
jgi:DNA-binding MarR family transcriptional regulator